MTFDQITQVIERIITLLVMVGGVVGTIWGGIKAIKNAKKDDEERTAKKEKDLEDRNIQRKRELEESERKLQDQIDALREQLTTEMENRVKRLEAALDRSRKENKMLRQSGLMLIEAIEEGIRARRDAPSRLSAASCAACLAQDQTLLAKLQEVAILFRKEGDP